MTDKEFCKLDTEYYGEVVDNIKQISLRSFNGEELKEYVEHCIKLNTLNIASVDSRRELLKDGLKLSFNQWKEHNGIDYNCGKFEDKYGTRYKTKAIQSMYQDYISL